MDRRTVLIVEDEPDNRDVMRAIVEELAEANVLEAADGEQALAVASTQRPDLILLDLVIPRVDGFEVARRLKANADTAAIPIIAITALALPGERREAMKAGCDDYIEKPFDVDVMLRKIAELINRAAERAKLAEPAPQPNSYEGPRE